MYVLIDAADVNEVSEIVHLLLANKKTSFHVFNDENELIGKLQKSVVTVTQNAPTFETRQQPNTSNRTSPTDNESSYTPKLNWACNYRSTDDDGCKSETDILISNEFKLSKDIYESLRDSSPEMGTECAVCHKMFPFGNMTVEELSQHAIQHTDINRYKCPFINCHMRSQKRNEIEVHMSVMHNIASVHAIPIYESMSNEDRLKLMQFTIECFPKSANSNQADTLK